ncbi:hypothetical protein FRB91_003254 [Serendipita sp. 411]|nr:hypothetical protein FRB91_003254 [Serendipita sp. 411]
MSLKFMQRAAASSGEQTQEAERARVVDDSEWYIARPPGEEISVKKIPESPQILTISNYATAGHYSNSNVTQEASYMPFLYSSRASSSDDEDQDLDLTKQSSSKSTFRGRRTFKDGEEQIIGKTADLDVPSPEELPVNQDIKVDPKPITSSRTKEVPVPPSNRKNKKKRPASDDDDQQLDYADNTAQPPSILSANTFARPSGVFTKETKPHKASDEGQKSDVIPAKKKLKKTKLEASD